MARRGRVSLREIAEKADVSVTTVSRVLSAKSTDRFPAETRERVLQTARALQYRPNLLAQAIRGGKTRTIGVLVPPFDSFWVKVVYGIHDALIEHDHVPLVLWPTGMAREGGSRGSGELAQVHRMTDRAVDGLIIWPLEDQDAVTEVEVLARDGVPVVTIDHELEVDGATLMVGTDEIKGVKLVAEHLLELGHRRFIHLAGPAGLYWSRQRREQFEETIRAVEGASCITLPETDESTTNETLARLLSDADGPTAVFAATDRMARQALRTAQSLDLRVPEDLSIVGEGNLDFAEDLGLTSISQYPFEIGISAADLVVAASDGSLGEEREDRRRLHTPDLLVRSTTGPAPSRSK